MINTICCSIAHFDVFIFNEDFLVLDDEHETDFVTCAEIGKFSINDFRQIFQILSIVSRCWSRSVKSTNFRCLIDIWTKDDSFPWFVTRIEIVFKRTRLLFVQGDQKFRARREKNSSSEFFCFQKGNKGTDAEFSKFFRNFHWKIVEAIFVSFSLWKKVSSSVETFSVTQDIDPPTECTPQVVTFRPEFPTNLKTRCLPFGAGKIQLIRSSLLSKSFFFRWTEEKQK